MRPFKSNEDKLRETKWQEIMGEIRVIITEQYGTLKSFFKDVGGMSETQYHNAMHLFYRKDGKVSTLTRFLHITGYDLQIVRRTSKMRERDIYDGKRTR